MLMRPVTRSFLEEHHVYGVANDPDATLALCFNCHALATEGLLQAGVTMIREPDSRKFAANMFRATAVHLKMLGEANGRFAAQLEQDDPGVFTVEYRGTPDIIAYILRKCWPIWKVHRGNVPATTLRQLEIDGDWPRGCATAAMKRIGKDEDLRFKLQRYY